MQQDNIERWRRQMGRGIADWASAPGMLHEVKATSWLMLSGAPSPDVNLALVSDGDPDILSAVVEKIEQMGCPALLLLTGEGIARASDLTEAWKRVGVMPMMFVELARAPHSADPRVRRAGPADVETVTALLADAYDLDRDIARIPAGALTTPSDAISIWLLEQDGVAVSTVTVCRIEDVVSLWCMGTPERFGRRGYGRALLAAVLEDSLTLGATTGLLAATPAGLPLYEANGWQHVEDWQIFTNAVSAQFS
jgi:GNAT superfamily N-acetyltransferase